MQPTLQHLAKEIDKIDIIDICSCWQWRLKDQRSVILVSCLGDMFLLWNDNSIYWLQTDGGELIKVAENLSHFEQLLTDENNRDVWFLPSLIEKLMEAGKILKDNEVYSFKIMPVLGGEYSINNIEPVDMSVHFAFTGQISEQIKDLPNGTKVNINLE